MDFLNRLRAHNNTSNKPIKPQLSPQEIAKQQQQRIEKIERAKKLQAQKEAEELKRIQSIKDEKERKAAEEANRPKVTFVMTACGRPDLMERTLDSFIKFNTYPIERWIITEDSADPEIFAECKRLNDKKYNNKLEFVFNERKLGQSRSIDKAYAMVETEYVFHCEEDWEFYDDEFIEQSLTILKEEPTVLQAWIRPKSDRILNDIKPEIYEIAGITVRDVLPKSFMVKGALPSGGDLIVRDYMGFSWNPGLKRMSDYYLLPKGYAGFEAEHMIDAFYRSHSTKFKVVSISENDEQGFVRHIGWGRRADDPLWNEDEKSPQDLEKVMLEARKKREEDKKRAEEAEAKRKAAEEAEKNKVKLPKVSVVMQVYLGEYPGSRADSEVKFHRAVKSFLDQDYKNSELIIASDGCKIVEEHYYKYYKDNKQIKYVYVDKTGLPNMYDEIVGGARYYRGIPREAGRSLADGELITYMDSDDVLHPKFVYQIVYQHNMQPDAVWYLNGAWLDHINILKMPVGDFLEEYKSESLVNIKSLNDAKFIKTQVKPGLIVNTPWLLTHRADIKTRWKDTIGQTSEDVDFGRRLREDYPGMGYRYDVPVYLRCHYTGLWDI